MSWSHLAVAVPAECTAFPYNVRIVENKAVGLMFAGCVAEQRCIDEWAVLNPYGWVDTPTNTWQCNTCVTIVSTARATSATLGQELYHTLDGSWWLSVWLGVENHHDITVVKTVEVGSLPF